MLTLVLPYFSQVRYLHNANAQEGSTAAETTKAKAETETKATEEKTATETKTTEEAATDSKKADNTSEKKDTETSSTEEAAQTSTEKSTETSSETAEQTETKKQEEAKNVAKILAARSAISDLSTDGAYLTKFQISKIVDGTGPFDTSEDASDPLYKNRRGNDESASNKKIRTFDSITYDIDYETNVTDSGNYYSKGKIEFEMLIPYTSQEALWDTDAMSWIDSGFKVVEEERTYDFDGDGIKETKTCQVLKGSRTLNPTSTNQTVIPGSGTLQAVLKVRAMKNGDVIRPVMTAWMEHNDVGDKPTEEEKECSTHSRKEAKIVQAEEVEVTAQPRYNVQLKQDTSFGTVVGGTYDFDTGNDKALDKGNGKVKGTMTSYGITIQLYNDTGKNLKGIELPSRTITFDAELSTSFTPASGELTTAQNDYVSKNYAPLVWAYGEQKNSATTEDGRTLSEEFSNYFPYTVAPLNNQSGGSWQTTENNACYNGGNWNATKTGNTVSVTISDYVIDVDKFPNTNYGNTDTTSTYFNPKTGVENIGCFSAGKMYVLTPIQNNGTTDPDNKGKRILEDLGVSDGSFTTTVKDVNMKAISVSGQKLAEADDNSNQINQKDDVATAKLYLKIDGKYDGRSQYTSIFNSWTSSQYDPLGRLYSGSYSDDSYWGTGKDVLTRGKRLGITGGFYNEEKGDSSNRVYAADVLLKFDADGFTPDGKYTFSTRINDGGFEGKVYFAAKKDGTNWTNDSEMNKTEMEELVYYESLEALQKDGKTCIGALGEFRPKDGNRANIKKISIGAVILFQLNGQINNDAEIGKVYQTTRGLKFWRIGEYDACNGNIPSLLKNNPDYPTELPKETIKDYHDYEKAYYDDNGYAGGHTGNYNYGDSVLIITAKTNIAKKVEQKENGSDKAIYQLDNEQRYVDYVLTPSFDKLPDGLNETTTVTITDILPAKLSYVPNTSYIGGTYTQNSSSGRTGTITGGTQTSPDSVTKNKDGTTTIVWKLVNVNTADSLPVIHYSAKIGEEGSSDDADNNEQFTNVARITSTGDKRDYQVTVGNEAQAGIKVSKLIRNSISKIADERYHDPIDSISYTINAGNNSDNRKEKQLIMDMMPMNGDSRGNQFHGKVEIKSVKVDTASLGNISEWKCYYTTDEAVKDTTAVNYKYDDIINTKTSSIEKDGVTSNVTWEEAAIDNDGNITGLQGKSPTALVWLGPLNGQKTLKVSIKMKVIDGKGGDIVINGLSSGDVKVNSTVYLVDRTISGLPWLDADMDGQRSADEKIMTGITVTLLKKNAEGNYVPVEALQKDGESDVYRLVAVRTSDTEKTSIFNYYDDENNLWEIEGVAKADGSYEFKNLPPGSYGVRFGGSNNSTADLGMYLPTKQNVGDDATDSDTEIINYNNNKVLVDTRETGIELPEAKDMVTQHFESKYHDSGFYGPVLKVSKTVTGNMGDKSKDFKFSMVLTAPTNQKTPPADLVYAKGDQTGTLQTPKSQGSSKNLTYTYTFTLGHGEEIEFNNMPAGFTYEIKETNADDYDVTATNDTGKFDQAKTEVSFTNNKDISVPTLASMNTKIPIILAIIAFGGVVAYLVKRHRYRPKH